MQAAGTDVLGLLIDLTGELCDAADGIGLEGKRDAFRREQGLVLLDQGVLRLGQDALEILLAQRLELDANREAALELRDEVGRLRHVEGAGCDEEDVVRADRAVLRRDLRALDDWQDVTLHAFTRDIGARTVPLDSDFVDLIEEDDAAVLRDLDGLFGDGFHVDELASFFLREDLAGLCDRDLALLVALRHDVADHVLQVITHALEARAREHADHRAARLLDVDLDELVLELTLLEALADPFAASLILLRLLGLLVLLLVVTAEEAAERVLQFLRLRHEDVKDALLGLLLRLVLHLFEALLTDHAHGGFRQVADDGLDIAADVADFRELRRLDLDERRAHELCETACDLRLADARRANHHDVLRDDFFLHGPGQLAAAPAVAQSDGHRALRLILADDVAVEFFYDLARRLFVDADTFDTILHQSSSSTLIL